MAAFPTLERGKTRQQPRGAGARETENEPTSAFDNVEVTDTPTRAVSEARWVQKPVGRGMASDSQCRSLCGLKGKRTVQTMGLHREVGPSVICLFLKMKERTPHFYACEMTLSKGRQGGSGEGDFGGISLWR